MKKVNVISEAQKVCGKFLLALRLFLMYSINERFSSCKTLLFIIKHSNFNY